MRARRCIEERGQLIVTEGGGTNVATIRGPSIWHIVGDGERTDDFCPILCSADEGITFPGNGETRRPTCPECIAVAKARAKRAAVSS